VDRVVGQLRDRLLVSQERLELLRQDAEQRVGSPRVGEAEGRRPDRLRIGAVDDRALVAADDGDAVARAEERVVALDDLAHQQVELRLDADLRR
jgi:hypothetical protein